MKLSELGSKAAHRYFSEKGIWIKCGPVIAHVRTPIRALGKNLQRLYGDFPVWLDAPYADFHVSVQRAAGPRGWVKPKVLFYLDRKPPFTPLPLAHAMPLFEWGMNWCVASHFHHYLILHAAVLEKNGRALVMPAPSGSGKSTLCAALMLSGWRLLSDELALIRPEDNRVYGLSRPVSLKNESIEVIRKFSTRAILCGESQDTQKGTVALLKPTEDSVARHEEPALPGWVILPEWDARATLEYQPVTRGEAFLAMAEQSFNYHMLGSRGFEALAEFTGRSTCLHLRYQDLRDAVSYCNHLAFRQQKKVLAHATA
jgi:HprK-related kinase A